MKILACQSVAKNPEDANDDAFMFSGHRNSCRYAIMADGATFGFAGGEFARTLSKAFLTKRSSTWSEIVDYARCLFYQKIDMTTLSWAQQISLRRGSYSTILAVKEIEDKGILVTSVGDTCCFLVNKVTCLPTFSFPAVNESDFGCHPMLIGTGRNDNLLFKQPFRKKYWKSVFIPVRKFDDSWLMLATDALSHFILSNRNDDNLMRSLISALKSRKQFSKAVMLWRTTNGMHVDDSSLALIGVV